jgi:hypothetical protein
MWGTLSDKGRICRLQLLLVLASAVILGSKSLGTHANILPSHIRDSSNVQGQVPVFISPSDRVAQLHPQALGSLFVASYDSQGYSGGIPTCFHTDVTNFEVKVKVALRLAVYRQSFRLGTRHPEDHDQRFFQLNSCGHSPYVTSFLTRS